MRVEYYNTDLGIVISDLDSIRLKSSYVKTIIGSEVFDNSNPVKITKAKYLESLNQFFRKDKHSWVYNGTKYRKMDNFECTSYGQVTNYNLSKDIPRHEIGSGFLSSMFICLYKGRLYYTFISGNYYPQMQLVDFHTKQLTGKWTGIKNLAPVFNCSIKEIV